MSAAIAARQVERETALNEVRKAAYGRSRLVNLASPEQIAEALGLRSVDFAMRLAQNPRLTSRLMHHLMRRMAVPEVRTVPPLLMTLIDYGPQHFAPILRISGLIFNARRLGPVLTKPEVEALRASFAEGEVDFAFRNRRLAPDPALDRRPPTRSISAEEALQDGIGCFHAWLEVRSKATKHFFENLIPNAPMMSMLPEVFADAGPVIVEHVLSVMMQQNNGQEQRQGQGGGA